MENALSELTSRIIIFCAVALFSYISISLIVHKRYKEKVKSKDVRTAIVSFCYLGVLGLAGYLLFIP